MYTVSKQFTFCYAHRLLGDNGRCAHLHGHTATAEVTLAVPSLNDQGMAHDFRDLSKAIRKWLDDNWDHVAILNQDDPLVALLRQEDEPCYLTKGNPTAEKLAHTLCLAVMKMKLPVRRVTIWESPTSKASFEASCD